VQRHAARHQRDLVEAVSAPSSPTDSDLEAKLLPWNQLSGCNRCLLQGVFTPMRRGCSGLYRQRVPHILVTPCTARSSICVGSPRTTCGAYARAASSTQTICSTIWTFLRKTCASARCEGRVLRKNCEIRLALRDVLRRRHLGVASGFRKRPAGWCRAPGLPGPSPGSGRQRLPVDAPRHEWPDGTGSSICSEAE